MPKGARAPRRPHAPLERRRWRSGITDLCKAHKVGPAQKVVIQAVADLCFDRPKYPEQFIGYGGRPQQEGKPAPKAGLAEHTGHSRRTCIRAKQTALRLGLLDVKPGGGRGKANSYRTGWLRGEQRPQAAPNPSTTPDPAKVASYQRNKPKLDEARAQLAQRGPPRPLRIS